jgi:hypothetical protein
MIETYGIINYPRDNGRANHVEAAAPRITMAVVMAAGPVNKPLSIPWDVTAVKECPLCSPKNRAS